MKSIRMLLLIIAALITSISCNTTDAIADEVITIVGTRIYNDTTIYCSADPFACQDFLNSISGAYGPAQELFTKDPFGGTIDLDREKKRKACETKWDDRVTECMEAVAIGGASMGGTICYGVSAIVGFFATHLVGGLAGVACGTLGVYGGNEAIRACQSAGADKKEQLCK